MAFAPIDGINLYYEDTGQGFPLVWSHEFAGSHESWENQVRYFSRRYRVITYNARGYPPSDVPSDSEAYTQKQSVEDLHGLLVHLGIDQAYIGGLSMGGGVTLSFGLTYPEMTKALIVAGAGTGSTDPAQFRTQSDEFAAALEAGGMEGLSDYVKGPTRVQILRKNPRAWEEFARLFASHSAIGSAHTLRGVQGKRQTIYELEDQLRKLAVPTLILAGDEDDPCIEPGVFMKRCISRSGLVFFPQSGHTINLEEPELFNKVVDDFLIAVEAGRWAERQEGSGVGFLARR
ncbi:MAG: Pimeloyl-ACP methyl ester carboxylesterase [Chloroflexi bacterium]|jgi:pimeloyl-ACP methyl ester carboxylesterase|nr:MAG: Pimeloyl-ACP methyl ester carboxylesterase [Chloroflexota bacterium]